MHDLSIRLCRLAMLLWCSLAALGPLPAQPSMAGATDFAWYAGGPHCATLSEPPRR